MKKLSDLLTELNGIIRDQTSGRVDNSDRIRAINQAVDDINGEGSYKLQTETENISYVVNIFDYTPTLRNFKAPARIKTPTTSSYRRFRFVEEDYFNTKVYAAHSGEPIFTVSEIGGVRTVKINHFTTETLAFEFFSENMVLDADGVTRKIHFENNDDTTLIPDRHIFYLLHRAAKVLLGYYTADNTEDRKDENDEYLASKARFEKEFKINTPKETRRLAVRVPNYSRRFPRR